MNRKVFAVTLLVALVLMFASMIFVNAGNFATITVDGDVSDWAGISPVPVEGYDAFYIANDQEYLYVRIDQASWLGNITLAIDVDLDWETTIPVFFPAPLRIGDAWLIDNTIGGGPWYFRSYSPYTEEILYDESPDTLSPMTLIKYNSDNTIVEYGIPLDALDVRNPDNLIWIRFPWQNNNEMVYDLELRATVVSMQVVRDKGTPVTYFDTFEARDDVDYTLIVTNINLTSIEVKINGFEILKKGDGNIDFEDQIPSEYLNVGTNQISVTPKGLPETLAKVDIVIK
jgi:hypothetical protein